MDPVFNSFGEGLAFALGEINGLSGILIGLVLFGLLFKSLKGELENFDDEEPGIERILYF